MGRSTKVAVAGPGWSVADVPGPRSGPRSGTGTGTMGRRAMVSPCPASVAGALATVHSLGASSISHHADPYEWHHGPLVGDVTRLATASRATGPGWRALGRLGVPDRSGDGGRDEFPECCPTRASRSRTRSSNRTIVARCSAIVARSSPTSACKVAITVGITHQNVHRNPPGTWPRERL